MFARTLLSLLAFAALCGQLLAQSESGLHELRVYSSEPGRQADVLKLISQNGVKFMAKYHIGLAAVWTPLDSKDERVFMLVSHKDKKSCDEAWASFQNDADWKKAVEASMVAGKKPVKSFERIFLTTNDYSPKLDVKNVGNRVFELRTYIATPGNLERLNNRFRNHTVKLFEKHGMTNIVYWSVLNGETMTAAKLLEAASPVGNAEAKIDANLPAAGNALVYFLAHASPEAAKESFGKFGKDEEWSKARQASEADAGGSLTAGNAVKSLFLKPVDFSPLK